MTDLERAREEKSTLYNRIREAREAALAAKDPSERRRQKERERILKSMYQEACETVRRLDPAVVQRAPAKKHYSNIDTANAAGAVWADLEGRTWAQLGDQLPTTGRQLKRVQELVGQAMATCSQTQLEYMNAYYGEGLTLDEIGERHGTEKSTVSRTLKRGRRRVEDFITAKLLIEKCVDERGKFHYQLFLDSTHVLTERQKELVWLILARDTSYRDLAGWLGRSPSTVYRSVDRAEEKLAALNVSVDVNISAILVDREDWCGRSEKELAADLGLSPAFYYRIVRRGETVDGVPLFHAIILNRLYNGYSPKDIAQVLGCSRELVKRVSKTYGTRCLPGAREDYEAKAVPKIKAPDNPFSALGGDAIIDRIDAGTYRALQERFGYGSA